MIIFKKVVCYFVFVLWITIENANGDFKVCCKQFEHVIHPGNDPFLITNADSCGIHTNSSLKNKRNQMRFLALVECYSPQKHKLLSDFNHSRSKRFVYSTNKPAAEVEVPVINTNTVRNYCFFEKTELLQLVFDKNGHLLLTERYDQSSAWHLQKSQFYQDGQWELKYSHLSGMICGKEVLTATYERKIGLQFCSSLPQRKDASFPSYTLQLSVKYTNGYDVTILANNTTLTHVPYCTTIDTNTFLHNCVVVNNGNATNDLFVPYRVVLKPDVLFATKRLVEEEHINFSIQEEMFQFDNNSENTFWVTYLTKNSFDYWKGKGIYESLNQYPSFQFQFEGNKMRYTQRLQIQYDNFDPNSFSDFEFYKPYETIVNTFDANISACIHTSQTTICPRVVELFVEGGTKFNFCMALSGVQQYWFTETVKLLPLENDNDLINTLKYLPNVEYKNGDYIQTRLGTIKIYDVVTIIGSVKCDAAANELKSKIIVPPITAVG